MAFSADFDASQRPRRRVFAIGLLVGLALIAGVVLWLPRIASNVQGGADKLDDQLREQRIYMQTLCRERYRPERDQALCACVWATDYPALDCNPQYLDWTVAVARSRCEQEPDSASEYCACIAKIPSDARDDAVFRALTRCDDASDAPEPP